MYVSVNGRFESQRITGVQRYARELLTLDPGNAQLRDLISELEQRQAH